MGETLYEAGRDPYRYVILAVYLYISLLVGLAINPLTPIAATSKKIYAVGGGKINLSTSTLLFANSALSLPAVAFADRVGVKVTAILGTLLLSLGFTIRTLINTDLNYIFWGQIVAGIGCPFITCVQAKVLSAWLAIKHRPLWTALTTLSPGIGIMIGFGMPILFVQTGDTLDYDQQRQGMFWYLFTEAVLAIVGFLAAAFLWKTTQKFIPADDRDPDRERLDELDFDYLEGREKFFHEIELEIYGIFTQVKACLSRRDIRNLLALSGPGFGLSLAISSTTTGILSCFKYSEIFGPLVSWGVVLFGLGGSLFYSLGAISSPKQARNLFPILGMSAITSALLAIFLMYGASILWIVLVAAAIGLFSFMLNLLVSEELLRRVPSTLLTTATSLSNMSSQLFAAIAIYLSGFVLSSEDEVSGSLTVIVFALLWSLLFFYAFTIPQTQPVQALTPRSPAIKSQPQPIDN